MKRPPGADPLARQRALRTFSTDAEKLLWRHLRNRQVASCKFRRQTWLGPFIVDFVCLDRKLVIEADGGQHALDVEYDARRTAWLEKEGYRVLRFWNNDVLTNAEGVLSIVVTVLSEEPSPSHSAAPSGPLPLPCRERG